VDAEPYASVARFEDGHDSRRAEAVRVAGLDGNRFQPMVGGQFLDSAPHRAYPQRAVAIEQERHHEPIAERVPPSHDGIDVGGLPVGVVELHQPAAHRPNP
jgi:hypothetical protein